ncbi:hypothetical protein [Bordetella sp. 2513F-2]
MGALSISALKRRLSGNSLKEKVAVLHDAVSEIQKKLHAESKEEAG